MSSQSSSNELRDRARKLADVAYHDFWTTVVECSEILQRIDPSQRRPWLLKVLKELHHEQNELCALCGDFLVFGEHEVDHIIPHCYGGGNERANIQLVHPECNRRKGKQMDPYDLLGYLEDRYMNL
jgi:5-methylcytosine-specific restriction endonuclease McrA